MAQGIIPNANIVVHDFDPDGDVVLVLTSMYPFPVYDDQTRESSRIVAG